MNKNFLHYAIIVYHDLIVLPDIFKKNFIKSANFELNRYFDENRNKHPDAQLAGASLY